MAFLKLIPMSVWIGLAAAIAMAAGVYAIDDNGYNRGASSVQAKWDADRAAQLKRIAELESRNAQVVVREVIKYRDRIQIVKEKGDEVIREIPVLVPMDSPVLAGGFRVLHDAAASGELPADPAGAAAAAAPIESAALIRTTAENYTSCRAGFAQLEALQAIVKGAMQ